MTQITYSEWKKRIEADGDASILQSPYWGEVKSAFGWNPVYIADGSAGAMVLFRKPTAGVTAAYIPRGPIGTGAESLWPEIHQLCRKKHAVFLRVEPNQWKGTPEGDSMLRSLEGFQPAFATVQPPRTIVIPLAGTEDDWLNRMNQKTRYNIRLSQRKDLEIEESYDAGMFHQLMNLTGSRDAFGVHSEAYYQKCLDAFKQGKEVRILCARYQGKPLAAIMLFIHGKHGYYLYGASSNEERNRMPNHLLQWTAMKICASAGCEDYDLWGIPDAEPDVLEAQFQNREDGLWQVYRFKRGFGGEIRRTLGSFDYVYLPLLYRAAASLHQRKVH